MALAAVAVYFSDQVGGPFVSLNEKRGFPLNDMAKNLLLWMVIAAVLLTCLLYTSDAADE